MIYTWDVGHFKANKIGEGGRGGQHIHTSSSTSSFHIQALSVTPTFSSVVEWLDAADVWLIDGHFNWCLLELTAKNPFTCTGNPDIDPLQKS